MVTAVAAQEQPVQDAARRQAQMEIDALERASSLRPEDAATHRALALYVKDLIPKQVLGDDHQSRALVTRGLAAASRAIDLDGNDLESLIAKNVLLRFQARYERDRGRQSLLIDAADALRVRIESLTRRPRADLAAGPVTASAAPTQPTARVPCAAGAPIDGQPPVRVGGNIPPPAKTKDRRPIYPHDAMAAGVQGVVVMEVIIDQQGRIASACVLRSAPGLDDAALDAVSAWEFRPTLLNGVAVPVIMTVTVNFTLG